MRSTSKIVYFWVAVFAAAVFVLGIYFINFGPSLSGEQQTWAHFGDYIGGVFGTATSFAALYMVFVTYRDQRDQFITNMEKQNEMLRVSSHAALISGLSPQLDRYEENIRQLELEYEKLVEFFRKQGDEVTAEVVQSEIFTAQGQRFPEKRMQICRVFKTLEECRKNHDDVKVLLGRSIEQLNKEGRKW